MNQQLPFDITNASEVTCDECSSDIFENVYRIKRMSAMLSPNGEEFIIPIQLFACKKCGHINESMIPDELK
jgi:hypothetical protein